MQQYQKGITMKRSIKKNRHSRYNLMYHLVVITKYRHKCISKEMLDALENIFERLLNNQDCNLIEFNGEADHIHVLFESPPQVKLSKLINTLKTVSSRLIRKRFKPHIEKFYWKSAFWSRSYLIISTGGASIEIVKEYIQNQDQKKLNSSPPKS